MSNANNAGTVELNALPTGALNNNVVTSESTDQRSEITELDETEARNSQSESDLYEDEDITNYHNTLYRLEAGPDARLPVPRRSNLALEHVEDVDAQPIPEWPAPPVVAVPPPNNGLSQTILISGLALLSLAYILILALAGRNKLSLIQTKAAAIVTLVMSLFVFFMLGWIAVASPYGIAMRRWYGGLLRRGWGWINRLFRG